mgnify:CR=1 FL=1
MNANDILPVVIYILSSILLITLIILTIKIIITMNKIENVVDNITVKIKTLDGLFSVVEVATNKFTIITDKIVDVIAALFQKIFSSKRKGEDKNE